MCFFFTESKTDKDLQITKEEELNQTLHNSDERECNAVKEMSETVDGQELTRDVSATDLDVLCKEVGHLLDEVCE